MSWSPSLHVRETFQHISVSRLQGRSLPAPSCDSVLPHAVFRVSRAGLKIGGFGAEAEGRLKCGVWRLRRERVLGKEIGGGGPCLNSGHAPNSPNALFLSAAPQSPTVNSTYLAGAGGSWRSAPHRSAALAEGGDCWGVTVLCAREDVSLWADLQLNLLQLSLMG